MIISLEQLEKLIWQSSQLALHNRWSEKKHMIDLLEELDTIKVCDSAYPIDWHRDVTDVYGLHNIGNWCWAYQPDAAFGIPIPCCLRALTMLEIMIHDKRDGVPIYKPNYLPEDS